MIGAPRKRALLYLAVFTGFAIFGEVMYFIIWIPISVSSVIDEIESKHWELVLERIEKAFTEGNPKKYLYGRFNILFFYARSLMKEGILKLTNRTFQSMLERIIQEGLLVRQEDDSYRLAENYNELKKQFLSKDSS